MLDAIIKLTNAIPPWVWCVGLIWLVFIGFGEPGMEARGRY